MGDEKVGDGIDVVSNAMWMIFRYACRHAA